MDHMTIRLIIGLLLVVAVVVLAGKRALTLFKLITSGQKTVDRPESRPAALESQATEVLGQKKLLKWTVPGTAHVFAMWGFFVLTLIHTVLVLSMLWTSFAIYTEMELLASFVPYILWLVSVLVPVSAAIEAALAGLVGAVVALRLKGYLENRVEEPAED